MKWSFYQIFLFAITKGKSKAEKAITNSTSGPQILVSFVFFLFADHLASACLCGSATSFFSSVFILPQT